MPEIKRIDLLALPKHRVVEIINNVSQGWGLEYSSCAPYRKAATRLVEDGWCYWENGRLYLHV